MDYNNYSGDSSNYGENSSNYGETALPNIPKESPPSLRPGFKSVCARIGVMMIVVFGLRLLMQCIFSLLNPYFEGITPLQDTLISFAAAFVFLNVIPIAIGMAVLKFPLKERAKTLYAKPKYAGRAIGMFPAMYGAAMLMQLLTMFLAWLVSVLFPESSVSNSFNATQSLLSGDLPSAIIRTVQAVIFAPILEELWFRGLVLESLRPYGNGFAIFISAILFGITHANLAQFFYATAIGFFLAYIAIHTGSIIVPMILHAIMNGISSVTSIIITLPGVQDYLTALDLRKPDEPMPPVESPAVVVYLVWNAVILLLMAVGIIMLIVKLVKIKRYKVPKVQTELSAGTRWGIFLSRPTVIISLIFALDTMTVAYITIGIVKLLFKLVYGIEILIL